MKRLFLMAGLLITAAPVALAAFNNPGPLTITNALSLTPSGSGTLTLSNLQFPGGSYFANKSMTIEADNSTITSNNSNIDFSVLGPTDAMSTTVMLNNNGANLPIGTYTVAATSQEGVFSASYTPTNTNYSCTATTNPISVTGTNQYSLINSLQCQSQAPVGPTTIPLNSFTLNVNGLKFAQGSPTVSNSDGGLSNYSLSSITNQSIAVSFSTAPTAGDITLNIPDAGNNNLPAVAVTLQKQSTEPASPTAQVLATGYACQPLTAAAGSTDSAPIYNLSCTAPTITPINITAIQVTTGNNYYLTNQARILTADGQFSALANAAPVKAGTVTNTLTFSTNGLSAATGDLTMALPLANGNGQSLSITVNKSAIGSAPTITQPTNFGGPSSNPFTCTATPKVTAGVLNIALNCNYNSSAKRPISGGNNQFTFTTTDPNTSYVLKSSSGHYTHVYFIDGNGNAVNFYKHSATIGPNNVTLYITRYSNGVSGGHTGVQTAHIGIYDASGSHELNELEVAFHSGKANLKAVKCSGTACLPYDLVKGTITAYEGQAPAIVNLSTPPTNN